MPAKLPDSIIREALKLQDRCWTAESIADHLQINVYTLRTRLWKINKAAHERLLANRTAIKAKQLRQLEYIAHEAMQAFERSTKNAQTVKKTKAPAGKRGADSEEKTEITVKGQSGNPAFLAEARAALAEIRDILGLDHKHATEEQPGNDFVIDVSYTEDDQTQPLNGSAT